MGASAGQSARILICTPFGRDGTLIANFLEQAGVESEVCTSIERLASRVLEGAGAAIIGDEALSPAAVTLLADSLAQQPPWSDFPLLIMTSGGDETEGSIRRVRILAPLGNVSLLERPLRRITLLSSVRAALRARQHQYQIRDHLAQREEDGRALRESEMRYRTLAEALPQLVWTCSPDGTCDYLSRQWVEYTGIPAESQLGLAWLELVVHPEDRERTYQAWIAAVCDRAPYDLEFRLQRHDGSYRWFKTRGTPVRETTGEIVRWFGTCTDIDDQKRAEEERRQLLEREQGARKTAELLNRIGPTLLEERDPRALAQKITDIATQLTRAQFGALFHNLVNEKGESYMLYTLSGVPREAFSRFPMPRNTAIFSPTFHNLGIVRSDDITKDPRYGKNAPYHGMPEGHLPVRSYLAAPVVSGSGEVLGGLFFGHSSVGVFTEAEEVLASGIAAQAAIALDNAKLFAAARRANEELRSANSELQQFAYSASHDLQEPLRMVAIYSQLLQKKYGGHLDAQAEEYLGYAVQGATRMEQLVKDLLLYSQVTSEIDSVIEPTDVNAALDRALANLHGLVEESGASIFRDLSGKVPVREVHLQQLFQNLVSNGLKYRGESPPCIRITSRRLPKGQHFSISDNGIGIDQQYAEHIFGIFKRLHGATEYSGTGIGLAICKKIVERYGGRIWVESQLGIGSTFSFTIPDKFSAEPSA
jgi:PAS domain S-box-containing protein